MTDPVTSGITAPEVVEEPKVDGSESALEKELTPAPEPAEAEGDAPSEAEGKEDEEKVEGAPEAYVDFSMPEGVEVNNVLMTKFQEVAKELNLSQEAAQKIVDAQTSAILEQEEAAENEWSQMTTEWLNAAKNDPEIGGARWDETVSQAQRVISHFGNDGLREMLDVTGLGNNKEMIKFVSSIAKSMGEDSFHSGSGPSAPKRSQAEILFPSMNKE